VQEYTGTVTFTFLGDCTLGGEEKNRTSRLSFDSRIAAEGPEYPFRYLTALTEGDDWTIANLEGVLTDRELAPAEKKYNFKGPTSHTAVLTQGSVECVNLANNHSHDYGAAGYADTQAALENAGIAAFGEEWLGIWRNAEGLRIGFIGVAGNLSGERAGVFGRRMEALQNLGCAAIIVIMHTGTEYDYTPDGYEKQIVNQAVEHGASLIIGGHPHVVQGVDCVGNVPVVYSLGNCVFGGNTHPRDFDALAVRAELSFEEGVLTGITLRLYPLCIASGSNNNNYSPCLLTGYDAARVLKKMERSTGYQIGEFEPDRGAVLSFPIGSETK